MMMMMMMCTFRLVQTFLSGSGIKLGTNQEESSEAATHEFLSIVSVTCRSRHSSLVRDLVRARVVKSLMFDFVLHVGTLSVAFVPAQAERECQFLFQQGVAQSR